MKLLHIIDPDGVISRHKRSLKRTYRTKVCVCVCVCACGGVFNEVYIIIYIMS